MRLADLCHLQVILGVPGLEWKNTMPLKMTNYTPAKNSRKASPIGLPYLIITKETSHMQIL